MLCMFSLCIFYVYSHIPFVFVCFYDLCLHIYVNLTLFLCIFALDDEYYTVYNTAIKHPHRGNEKEKRK